MMMKHESNLENQEVGHNWGTDKNKYKDVEISDQGKIQIKACKLETESSFFF